MPADEKIANPALELLSKPRGVDHLVVGWIKHNMVTHIGLNPLNSSIILHVERHWY